MIRKFKKTDTTSLIHIWYQASSLAHPFLDTAFVEKTKKDLREIYIPAAETWVYEEKNIVIGFISMLGNEIGGLFVIPNHHSQGIGTKLVNYIGEFHDEIKVEVFKDNKIGRAFYDKYGFKLFKEQIHEETNRKVLRMKCNT